MKLPKNDSEQKRYCITPKKEVGDFYKKAKIAFGDLSTNHTIKKVLTMVCKGELVLKDGRTFEEKINSKLKIK